jgi:dissimilatory sulfite reductase (desulfoviridin) alpha/beta subunit
MTKTEAKTVKLDTEHTMLIDGVFTVDKAKWGTWRSFDADGNELVTSSTEEACIKATRCYLKWKQEGFTEEATSYAGTVGGKL